MLFKVLLLAETCKAYNIALPYYLPGQSQHAFFTRSTRLPTRITCLTIHLLTSSTRLSTHMCLSTRNTCLSTGLSTRSTRTVIHSVGAYITDPI